MPERARSLGVFRTVSRGYRRTEQSWSLQGIPSGRDGFQQEIQPGQFLFSPSSLSPAVAAEAERIARQVAEALDMVGVLAVEMFLTTTGELLVNRTGSTSAQQRPSHHQANQTSQYEQHLRAILGLPG